MMLPYLKTYREIQREKAEREALTRLKRNLLIVLGVLAALILLGLAGAIDFKSRYA